VKLVTVTIQKFRNFVEPQHFTVEPDVTVLVGKNESGKTTLLKALHRLNPAAGDDLKFDLTIEYPRWRLSRDRRANPELSKTRPVVAYFELEASDIAALAPSLPIPPPQGTLCFAARDYDNLQYVGLECPIANVVAAAAETAAVAAGDLPNLLQQQSTLNVLNTARAIAKELKESEPLRSRALSTFVAAFEKFSYLQPGQLDEPQQTLLAGLIPKFFYFSSYNLLPGEADLTVLATKSADIANPALTAEDRTVLALLAHAGETPTDFLEANYDSRKAELQAASTDLTASVFRYWTQNTDLAVAFDTDNVPTAEPDGTTKNHRLLKIELRDGRHGDIETNFSTRSAGFQWFFSFFAAFSEYQSSNKPIIVLLDEPALSLHGEAQKDFVRFTFEELGRSKQTVYTTHSQHMIDPTQYEKLRAVHDQATRENQDVGVKVTPISLAADRDTILPLESALGLLISQHLFIGAGHHLAVEGSSDFVFLQRFSEYLDRQHRASLDLRFAIIPVGGAPNMPVFVALLGRRLKVSVLLDGARSGSAFDRTLAAARANEVPETSIVVCSEIDPSLPRKADIEDLFELEDYLRLYNWTFDTNVAASDLAETGEPILRRIEALRGQFDHALPAHTLTARRDDFFGQIRPDTLDRFEKLMERLNQTLPSIP
jgi:energy-coupling factor transporter ATP-binding protein EcfA2